MITPEQRAELNTCVKGLHDGANITMDAGTIRSLLSALEEAEERAKYAGMAANVEAKRADEIAAELRRQLASIEQEATVKAVADTIERCAKLCEEYGDDKRALYKGRHPYTGNEEGRADPYVDGVSDGALYCCDAIRAMLPKEPT